MKVSGKGLVEFMRARADRQRSILYTLKFPDEKERASRGSYYSTAKRNIIAFHRESHPIGWLATQAESIDAKAKTAAKDSEKKRLQSNAKALRHYAQHFGNRQFVVQPTARFGLTIGSVETSVAPELYVSEKGRLQLVKLEFSPQLMAPDVVQLFLRFLAHAAARNGSPVTPTHCFLYHVPTGDVYRSPGIGSRFVKELEAACQTVEDIWDKLKKRAA
ncbi:MAG: hypothetical protein KF691_10445 [Phycisphaeraceae bacterium]|nr:hypothetical protein [Phycisphaeraceae bacterium]